YFQEEDFVREPVELGPSLGLMRSRNSRSFLVARRQEQIVSPEFGDDSEPEEETLPPKAVPQRRPKVPSKQGVMPRPVSPGTLIPRQRYLPADKRSDDESEEDAYDDPTCAAEPSTRKGHRGGYDGSHRAHDGSPSYPGPELPHRPLWPPSQ